MASLEPDLIFTDSLLESQSVAQWQLGAQFLWNPQTVEGVFDAMLDLGAATGLEAQATRAAVALRERFFRASDYVNPYTACPSVCVLESVEPLVVAGHWVTQLVERAGGQCPLNPTRPLEDAGAGAGGQQAHRVAGPPLEISPEALHDADPDVLIVCLRDQNLACAREAAVQMLAQPWWCELAAIKKKQCVLLDGTQMLTHPGPRIIDAYEWLVGWLNDRPELVPLDFPWEPLYRSSEK